MSYSYSETSSTDMYQMKTDACFLVAPIGLLSRQ